ncbi:hypothetical protein ACFLXD_06395 [Chloroflexota bacterium]
MNDNGGAGQTKAPLLEVVGLSAHFTTFRGRRVVKEVDGLSFHVNAREAVALIGESDCHVHPRCVYAKPVCSEQEPVLGQVAPLHFVACPFPILVDSRQM